MTQDKIPTGDLEARQVTQHKKDINTTKRILYVFFLMFLSMFVVGGFNVWYTNHVNEQRKEADTKQSQEGRRVFCALVNSQIRVYEETPPTTSTGRNSQQSWKQLGLLLQCTEE